MTERQAYAIARPVMRANGNIEPFKRTKQYGSVRVMSILCIDR